MLGPLLFLIYINDLKACPLSSYARMYADDTCLTASAIDPEMLQQLAVCVHKSISCGLKCLISQVHAYNLRGSSNDIYIRRSETDAQ